jgi:hypothetical protein
MNAVSIYEENIKILFPEKNPFKLKKSFISIDSSDYRNLLIPEKNTYAYVCGFLMKKWIEKHACDICINYSKSQKQLDESFLLC